MTALALIAECKTARLIPCKEHVEMLRTAIAEAKVILSKHAKTLKDTAAQLEQNGSCSAKEQHNALFNTGNTGKRIPSKVDLHFGEALQVFIQDNNGQPLVAESIYLTNRDNSGTYGGSLAPTGPNILGNDPSVPANASNAWPSAFATISASHISYYAPSQANSTGSVKARLVAVSGGSQRELLIDVN